MTSESRSPSGALGADTSTRAQADPSVEAGWPDLDRRQQSDRRSKPTQALSALFGLRRRRSGRRAREGEDIYVDAYARKDVLLIVGIFVLNLFDAFFTLVWLQRGGGEANPFMNWLLELGDYAFLIQKCFVVGLWLMILLVHKNFRLARLGLWSAFVVYALLILYHLSLIVSGVDPAAVSREAAERLRVQEAQAVQVEALEEAAEQRGHGAFDAQGTWTEAEGAQSSIDEPLELVVAPTRFRPNRQ